MNTFDTVRDIMVEECGIPREKITLESHVVDDLGLDSLGFLDLCYQLDTKFDIQMPFEQWVNDVNSGKISSREAFVVSNLVAEIDKLIAQRDTNESRASDTSLPG